MPLPDFSKFTDKELEQAAVELSRRRVARAHDQGVTVIQPSDQWHVVLKTPYGHILFKCSDDQDYNAWLEGKYLDPTEFDEEADIIEFSLGIQTILESKDDGELAQRSLEFIQSYKDLLKAAAVQEIIEK